MIVEVIKKNDAYSVVKTQDKAIIIITNKILGKVETGDILEIQIVMRNQ